MQYLQDEDVEVRRDAYSTLDRMLVGECVINKKQIEEQVCPTILSLTKKSFPDAQMEFALKPIVVLGRIVPIIGSEKTEEFFLDHFIKLCSCEVINIRKACATIFPIMCHVLGTNITETKLLDVFSQLCDDVFWGVRKACAETIPLISLIVSKECRKTRLAPIVLNLLEDINKWVTTSTYKILGEFISTFAEPCVTGLAYTYSRELRIINPTDPDFTELSDQNLLNNYVYYVNKFTESGLKTSQQQQQSLENINTDNKEVTITTPLSPSSIPAIPTTPTTTSIGNLNNGIVMNASIANLTPNEIAQIILDNKEKLIKQINSDCVTDTKKNLLPISDFYQNSDCDDGDDDDDSISKFSQSLQQQQQQQEISSEEQLYPEKNLDDICEEFRKIVELKKARTRLTEGTSECDPLLSSDIFTSSTPNTTTVTTTATATTTPPSSPSSPSASSEIGLGFVPRHHRSGRLKRLFRHESALIDLSSIIRKAMDKGKKSNNNNDKKMMMMIEGEGGAGAGAEGEGDVVSAGADADASGGRTTNFSIPPPPSSSQQEEQQPLSTCGILVDDNNESSIWSGNKLKTLKTNFSQNINNNKTKEKNDRTNYNHITNLVVDSNSNNKSATAITSSSLLDNPSSSSSSSFYSSSIDFSSNNNEIKSKTTTENSTNNNYNDNDNDDDEKENYHHYDDNNSPNKSDDDNDDGDDDFNSYKYWYIRPDNVSINDYNDIVVHSNKEEYHNDNDNDICRMIDINNQQHLSFFKTFKNNSYTVANDDDDDDDDNNTKFPTKINPSSLIANDDDDDDINHQKKFLNLIKINKTTKTSHNKLKEIILLYNFEQQQIVPSNILRNYVIASLRLNEEEIKLNCAYTFPAVVLTIGKENWNLIEPVMQYFCDELDWKVRKTIASSIDMLANILGKEITTRDLVPIYLGFFKDLDEVKIEAIKNFANFLTVVDLSRHDEILLNIGVCLRVDSTMNWRIKEDLAKQIFSLIEMYKDINKPENLLYLTSITGLFLEDKISCVREIAVEALASIVKISNQVHREAIINIFVIQEFALSDNWRKRQTFLNVLYKLITYNDQSLIDLFRSVFEHVEKLSHDPIPNIRLLVAKILVQLITIECNILEGKTSQDIIILETIKRLRTDKDRDVREISRSISIGDGLDEEEDEEETEEGNQLQNDNNQNEEEENQILDETQEAEGDENWWGIKISNSSDDNKRDETDQSRISRELISFLKSTMKDEQKEEESWDHETSFYVDEHRGEVMTTTTTITTAPATTVATAAIPSTITVSQESSNEVNT